MKKQILKNRKLLIVVGLVMLLPILAALQYRWIGQISTAEVDRIRANLETNTRQFGRAVSNEISPAQWAFRVSFTRSLDDIERELRLNYQFWDSRATHPDLIESIYWVDYDSNQDLRLFLFDPATGSLRQQPWPNELLGWRDYFLKRNRLQLEQYNPRVAGEAPTQNPPEDLVELSAELFSDRPALPIPVSIDSELSPEDLLANLNATSSGQAGHTLVTLNREYLVNTFFPSIHDEIFSADEDAGLRIVSRAKETGLIYQSDPSLTDANFDHPDVSHGIARIRWMSFPPVSAIAFGYASLMDRSPTIADSLVNQARLAWTPAEKDSLDLESPHHTDFPLQVILKSATDRDHGSDVTAEDLLVALTGLQELSTLPSGERAALSPPPQLYAWDLEVTHKTGSLEAAVGANRLRNLIMSFGILSILGIAVVMIYSSSRKSQLLAQRQVDFVTGVSHELRTPLAVIRSAAENLADGVVMDDKKMQKYGQLISREGRRLSDMVEQILELAGVQSGKRTLDLQTVDVSELINGVLSTWKDTISEKRFEVSKKIESNLPALNVDPQAIQLVLNNLINNALKYSNGHRWLGLEANQARNGRGPEIQIKVSDHGIGIPADELPHIFDDFYRGQEAQQAQIRGNGIGLSLVKKTMQAHGGRVTVDSKADQGSTFTLHFPLTGKAG